MQTPSSSGTRRTVQDISDLSAPPALMVMGKSQGCNLKWWRIAISFAHVADAECDQDDARGVGRQSFEPSASGSSVKTSDPKRHKPSGSNEARPFLNVDDDNDSDNEQSVCVSKKWSQRQAN